MDASVVKRIPLRLDYSRDYFPDDTFQVLPRDGYTALFTAIFNHPNISVTLNQAFDDTMRKDVEWCFNAMAIDAYFD